MTYLISNTEKIVSDKFDAEIIIVSLDSGAYYSLRGSAVDLWNLLEPGITADQIYACFDSLADTSKIEIEHFLNTLKLENLVLEVDSVAILSALNPQYAYAKISLEKFEDMQELISVHEVSEQDQLQ